MCGDFEYELDYTLKFEYELDYTLKFEYELDYTLKCDVCHKKPAVDLREPDTGEPLGDHKALCEKCGIEIYGEGIVSDWAGTELYLKKYPDEVVNWR